MSEIRNGFMEDTSGYHAQIAGASKVFFFFLVTSKVYVCPR